MEYACGGGGGGGSGGVGPQKKGVMSSEIEQSRQITTSLSRVTTN